MLSFLGEPWQREKKRITLKFTQICVLSRQSGPNGLVCWTQVLVAWECGCWYWHSCPWAKYLNHNCFVLRMGRKPVGLVYKVIQVKHLSWKSRGFTPVFLVHIESAPVYRFPQASELQCLKRGSKVKFKVLWCTHFSIDRVLMKLGKKIHKVSNLTLKWCKMPLYLIPFQCKFVNIQWRHISNIWGCSILYREFLVHSWISMIFNQNGIEVDILTNEKFLYGMYRPILLLTSNDVMFLISHWKSIKQNDILHHFNVRLETFVIFVHFHKDSIYWKISAE